MRGVDYVRSVFEDVIKECGPSQNHRQGAFLAAALEVMREIESPLKEETLVRLAILEVEEQRERGLRSRRYG